MRISWQVWYDNLTPYDPPFYNEEDQEEDEQESDTEDD